MSDTSNSNAYLVGRTWSAVPTRRRSWACLDKSPLLLHSSTWGEAHRVRWRQIITGSVAFTLDEIRSKSKNHIPPLEDEKRVPFVIVNCVMVVIDAATIQYMHLFDKMIHTYLIIINSLHLSVSLCILPYMCWVSCIYKFPTLFLIW